MVRCKNSKYMNLPLPHTFGKKLRLGFTMNLHISL